MSTNTIEENVPDLSNAPRKPDELVTIAEAANTLEKKHTQRVEMLEQSYLKKKAELEQSADAMGLKGDNRKRHLDSALAEFHRVLRDGAAAAELDTWMRELHEIDKRAELSRQTMGSEIAMLSVVGLGSEQRARYEQTFRDAPAQALQQYFTFAIANKDRVAGAALLGVISRLPRERREGMSPAGLAKALMASEYVNVEAARKRVRNAFKDCMDRQRAFTRGTKTGAVRKIASALSHRDMNRLDALAEQLDGTAG